MIHDNSMDTKRSMDPGVTFLRETNTRSSGSGKEAGLPEPGKKTCNPAQQIVILPKVTNKTFPGADLKTIFEHRQSVRSYSNQAISLAELSILLLYTQGIRESTGQVEFRYVPSAGARYPIETYLLINRVEELEPGIYRYLPLDHAVVLEDCSGGDYLDVARATKKPHMIFDSAVTFIWVACPKRVIWLFGERGWRYLFLDAGHICQNLYLAGEAIHCGVCAVGSFFDDEVNEAIGVDGEEEFVIYMATVGKK